MELRPQLGLRKPLLFVLALAFALVLTSPPALASAGGAPVFGSVVSIGGSPSDLALDEARGLLYVAEFGGSVIDAVSTTDGTIHSSFTVLPFPGAIALSFDAQYLLVAHYCNGQTSPACMNAITSIHLTNDSQQIFSLDSPPLGVAFLGSGQALVVTAANFLLMDPASGAVQVIDTIANIALALPVPLVTFPGQIVQAALTSSADGSTVWGLASAGSATQFVFQYTGATNSISATIWTSSPLLLPRVSSAADGSYAMVGYLLAGPGGYLMGRYPNIISSTNITGSAIDSVNKVIYAQFPDMNQPTGPATPGSGTPSSTSALLIMDSDNLTFRDRISIPENIVGRTLLNKAATMMYAISESGVMVLPVGALNSYHRVAAAQEDMLMLANFCNRSVLSQSLTITDPGGGATDFAITTTQPGVTISPATGITPLTVQVSVDPTVIPALGGTTVIALSVSSRSAVNQPKPVRLLVNNPDPTQRGTIVDQPGILSDIMPDQLRNRVYVLRQDMNQLLVFDGSSMSLLAKFRTATSPTMMAMTSDQKYMLVGHDDSQLLNIYDLNALQPVTPILMPGSHFARSIAVSNSTILALARTEVDGSGIIDSIDLNAGATATLPTLGVFKNSGLSPTGVLGSSPGGGNILYASPDGTVALYTASAGVFVTSRKDFTSLSGAFAASDYNSFVIGNTVFDGSLVPAGVVSQSTFPTSGFTFVDQGGYMAAAASSSAAGSLLRVTSMTKNTTTPPTLLSEAPLLAVSAAPAASSSGSSSSASTAAPTIYGTYGSGTNGNHSSIAFMRTVAPMASSGTVFLLSTSGITMLRPSSATNGLQPVISGITNAADGTEAVAPGGLISIYGQNLTGANASASGPAAANLPANSCLGLNGLPIPLLYVSPQQINGQLPFNISGSATLTIHTPGGASNNYVFPIQPTAPSIFMSASAGPLTGLATIVRDNNNQLVTATNPIFPKDTLTIYLTGMGQTVPPIQAGQPAPANPLSAAAVQPVVTLGGAPLSILYAGLAPGEVGVYQINAVVPFSGVPGGLTIPLVITQGGASTTLNVRVVN